MLGTHVQGGQGPGAAVTAPTGAGPFGFTDTMVITAWDPPPRGRGPAAAVRGPAHGTGRPRRWNLRGDAARDGERVPLDRTARPAARRRRTAGLAARPPTGPARHGCLAAPVRAAGVTRSGQPRS